MTHLYLVTADRGLISANNASPRRAVLLGWVGDSGTNNRKMVHLSVSRGDVTMPMKGARDVTITLRLDEDERNPWTKEYVEEWLRQELDFKEEVIDIIDISFPNGMLGDITDEDLDS